MNIQKISSFIPKFAAADNSSNNKGIVTNFGVKITSPLQYDTVSFKSTNKVAAKAMEVNRETALRIHRRLIPQAQEAFSYIDNLFGDLVVSTKEPKNPILKIAKRLKSVDSIKEKTGSRNWVKTEEILAVDGMTDLIGMKFELRDSNKSVVDSVLGRFIPEIKAGRSEILEIECKRPGVVKGKEEHEANKYDYANMSMLKKLVSTQNESWKKGGRKQKISPNIPIDYTPANYCATHFLIRIPGKKPIVFELQVMGDNMNKGKHVDDPVYKELAGKEPKGVTKDFKKLFEPLTNPRFFEAEGEERAKEIVENAKSTFKKYRGEVMLYQREKADMPYTGKKGRHKEMFLPIPYKLFPSDIEVKYGISSLDFDYNNIAKMIID